MKTLILLMLFALQIQAKTYPPEIDPFPQVERLLLYHTGAIEDYDWSAIEGGLAIESFASEEARNVRSYTDAYVQSLSQLNKKLKLPTQQKLPSLVQSIWVNQSNAVPVEQVWKTLMSYVKVQKSMVLLRQNMGANMPSTHNYTFRSVIFPHLTATLDNISTFHRILSFYESSKLAGDDPFAQVIRERIYNILLHAFAPYRELLQKSSAEIDVSTNTAANPNLMRVHQAVSLAKIFEGIKTHLQSFSIPEVSVLENIDAFTSLPAPFMIYSFFLKENQAKMSQNLDAQQLKQMFSIVMLADLLKFEKESRADAPTEDLNENMKALANQIRTEIKQTLVGYDTVVQAGVAP